MEYKNLIVKKRDDFLGIITLNRPKNLNTFNIQLAKELKNALESMDGDPKIRVIILLLGKIKLNEVRFSFKKVFLFNFLSPE